jgi:RNA polymerase sigma-70 factor, ECF subfamily
LDDAAIDLVRRARLQQPGAFAQLIGRYERAALAVAFGVLRDGDAAGDATQEAFLKAWQKLDTLKDDGRFGPWLVGIVRNVAMDHRRKRKPGVGELEENVPCTAPGPSEELPMRESRDALARAIDRLDETSRAAVLLRYYDDLGSREIGTLLDLSPAAVDMRLSRARQQLREMLKPSGERRTLEVRNGTH